MLKLQPVISKPPEFLTPQESRWNNFWKEIRNNNKEKPGRMKRRQAQPHSPLLHKHDPENFAKETKASRSPRKPELELDQPEFLTPQESRKN
jgi:hypothetical protein